MKEQMKIAQQDLLMEMLINIVNASVDLSIGITLFANGQTISGQLISYSKYLESVSNGFKQVEHEIGGLLGKSFEDILNGHKELLESNDCDTTPSFIHLKDVIITNSNNNKSNFNDTPIRIKISKITGFIIGTIN